MADAPAPLSFEPTPAPAGVPASPAASIPALTAEPEVQKPSDDEHAVSEQNAAPVGDKPEVEAGAPGEPPAADVKAVSEGRATGPDGQYSSQEDVLKVIDPVKPVEKQIDLPLPIFHPEVATAADEHDDATRPAIPADEIDQPKDR